MSNPDEMRSFLFDCPEGDQWASKLASKYPECACESATSPSGSSGPVDDNETLRFFVLSRSDVDVKRKKKFRPSSLSRMFKTGLSVCRKSVASDHELHLTAGLLFELMQKQYSENGGIVGVLDFRCSVVRHLRHEDGGRLVCVLETPLDALEDGGYARPSHADVVYGREHCEDEQAMRVKLFNAITISGEQPFKGLKEADDGQLAKFLPIALK